MRIAQCSLAFSAVLLSIVAFSSAFTPSAFTGSASLGLGGPRTCGRTRTAVLAGAHLRSRREGRQGLRMQLKPDSKEAVPVVEAVSEGDPRPPPLQTDDDTYAEALRNTGIVVAAAALFGAGVWTQLGAEKGIEFFTGYIVEESLSVDNLFVFLLLFQYFKVPEALQKRVLSWGILGAVVMRGTFISAGLFAVRRFRGVLLGFAAVLIFSAYKIFVGNEGEDDEDLSNNAVVKFSSNLVQSTKSYDGDNFFTMVDGAKRATPLLLVLLCVELSDILFAVDSIPAVFGVTEDPFIVFTSNIFAILGLRALYRVLSKLVEQLEYLEPAVGLVLAFIGAKMIAEFFGMDIAEEASLAVVISLLGSGVAASYMFPSEEEEEEATEEGQ
mmetsp:Transcript_57022/g.133797  ORF Transcript_57022/g.133797 Transcript_57022/m.133797 type:complete len:384 (-) Transcript_57022:19-1170(-)